MPNIKVNYEQPFKKNDGIPKYTQVRQTTRYRWQIQIAVTEQCDNRKPTLAWPQEHQGQQIADNVPHKIEQRAPWGRRYIDVDKWALVKLLAR